VSGDFVKNRRALFAEIVVDFVELTKKLIVLQWYEFG
jgi:hypothetical protein